MHKARHFDVALIGLGKMGRNHLRVLKEHGAFNVVAIVDPNPESESLSSPSVVWYKTVEDLCAGGTKFDTAIVASSTNSHLDCAMRLLSVAKVPMLVEKPLANNAKDAKILAQAAHDSHLPVFVGHTERCNPAVRKLQEVIASGVIGVPIHFATVRVGGFPNAIERKGTNVLLDLAVHDLDVINVIAGPIKLRSSVCHKTLDNSYPDTAHLLLSSATGSSASVHVNWITPTKIRSLEVTGSLGFARVDYILQTCKVIGGNITNRKERTDFTFVDVISDYMSSDQIEFGVIKREPLLIQAEEFYSFLSTGSCRLCTAEEGAKTVELAEMAITFGQGGMDFGRKAG